MTGAFAVFAGADFFGAAFWTATFVGAFLTVFFRAVFFGLAFFDTAGSGVSACFAAWNAAHRFLVAATIAFLPAAEGFHLGSDGSGVAFD
ncbi:MAG TPA: hypothetical protein VFD66_04585, partial [Verrucomicrobiae bacterium]|nr:hypothetical protein [Verrucomicrobiae bacterium]